MENIDEIIADAIAEEEVTKEQEKAAKKKKAADNFKKELKAALENMLIDIATDDEQVVKITLSEYISLVYMARDLDILKETIAKSLGLSYNKEYLVLNDSENILNAFKFLYAEEYEKIEERLISKGE